MIESNGKQTTLLMPKKSKFSYPVTTLAGSRLSNLISTCKKYQIERKYWGKLALTIVASSILEAFSYYEDRSNKKKIEAQKLEKAPVFIIGAWRSGTTLLHNLLCQDPNAAYTTTFQTVFPNLLLTQSNWLKPLANYIGPSKRPFDNVSMDMDFPQEEEFGLMNLQQHSIYKFFLFPADFDQILKEEVFTEDLPGKELTKWKQHYRTLVAKAILNTGGNRFISKNPCNITRVDILKEMYTGARFIFIYRNPYKVVESLYRFAMSVFSGVQLQKIPTEFGRKNAAQLYELYMRHYLSERENFTRSELLEIKMEDFVKDIKGHLSHIYSHFDLGDFASYESNVDAFLAKDQLLNNGYKIHQETIDLVNQNFPDIVKTLGYEKVESEMGLFVKK